MDGSAYTLTLNITNNSTNAITIDAIKLEWPDSYNGPLTEISLGGVKIFFNTPVASSPVGIPDDYAWKTGSGTRKLDPGASKDLVFLFDLGADSSGYSLEVLFDNSCMIEKSK